MFCLRSPSLFTNNPYSEWQSGKIRIDPHPTLVSKRHFFFVQNGFFACGRCQGCCKTIGNVRKRNTFISEVIKKQYEIRDCITCDTEGVVYCSMQHIGRTKWILLKRILKHFLYYFFFYIINTLVHYGDLTGLQCWGIERYRIIGGAQIISGCLIKK